VLVPYKNFCDLSEKNLDFILDQYIYCDPRNYDPQGIYDACEGHLYLFEEMISSIFFMYDNYWDGVAKKAIKNGKIKKMTQFKAFQIFKEDMPKYIRFKEYYEPETDIRQLKQWINLDNTDTLAAKEVTIEEVLQRENIKYNRRRAACPLCKSGNDTTLSFKDKLFKCFKCQESGDTITFVQKLYNLNFKEAVNYLTKNS